MQKTHPQNEVNKMTLLITVTAAVCAAIVWYLNGRARKLHIGTLCLMYWGASLMWLVDEISAYLHEGKAYFDFVPSDMLNDAFLGLSAVVLGMIVWLVIILVKDPEDVLKNTLFSKNKK